MSKATNELYEFGAFRMDIDQHTLERIDGAKNGHLREKAFLTLVVLIRNYGDLVTKEELIHSVWPDTIVEDNNLDKCIWAIRRFLGEKTGGDKYIETVPKHGYRFVADVRRIRPQNGTGPGIPETSETDNTRADNERSENNTWQSRIRVAALATFVILVGIAALGFYLYSSNPVDNTNRPRSFAVLPPKPIEAANREERYELGIADALIIRLNSVHGFLARPLSAMRQYGDMAQDPIAAGREQQVDYVLESHYQWAGGTLRFTSQLYDVKTGQVEHRRTSETDASDLFAMQDAIAGDIGVALQARFGAKPATRKTRSTANEQAYVLFLQGMISLDKRDPAVARAAIDKFEQAVLLDPNYSQAWAGIAHAHRLLGGMGRNANGPEQYRLSMDAAERALALDANLADAHSALCDNKTQYEWDWAGAELECKRAIELDPDSPLAHQIYSRLLMGRGRFDEAVSEVRMAIDLEPTSLFAQRNYGACLYFARRYPEAITQLTRVVEIEPKYKLAYPFLWQSEFELPSHDAEAFEWFMKHQAVNNADPETIESYNNAYRTSGWPGVLPRLAESLESSDRPLFHVAVAYARAGNKEKAFEFLEKSYQKRELWMHVLNVEPGLDSLRNDARFTALAKRVG